MFSDIKYLTVVAEMQVAVFFVLKTHPLATELTLLEVKIMIPEVELFYLLFDLDVIVVLCVLGPTFPYHCFVEVAPPFFLHHHVRTADQPQRAFEVLRAVA